MLHWGLGLLAVLVPAQMMFGHWTGDYVHKHQPAKFAAIEARWQTEQPASEVLIAWPDETAQTNRFAISIPSLGSYIATGTWNSREVGLETFRPEDRPPVAITFFTFRIMVGLGLIMLAIAWLGVVISMLGRLDSSRLFLRLTFISFPAGFVAVIAGWFTAEIGRQPWVVYGLLRTREAVTPSLSTADVAVSLFLYVLVYGVVYAFGVWYLYRLIGGGFRKVEADR